MIHPFCGQALTILIGDKKSLFWGKV